MRCPLDVDVDLVMTERQGVEIDYCPTCRGVWLDRGELDKILDRAAAQSPAPPPPATGHAAGHVPGEGGTGVGSEPVPQPSYGGPVRGGAGYGEAGYGEAGYGGYAAGGRYGRPDDDDRRYDDDHRDDRPRYDDDRRSDRPGYDPRRKKRKESWLGDLLDFG